MPLQLDPLQNAIDRGIRDSIIKDGIAAGEFTPKPSHTSLGDALAGAALAAAGGLLMSWFASSKQTPSASQAKKTK